MTNQIEVTCEFLAIRKLSPRYLHLLLVVERQEGLPRQTLHKSIPYSSGRTFDNMLVELMGNSRVHNPKKYLKYGPNIEPIIKGRVGIRPKGFYLTAYSKKLLSKLTKEIDIAKNFK